MDGIIDEKEPSVLLPVSVFAALCNAIAGLTSTTNPRAGLRRCEVNGQEMFYHGFTHNNTGLAIPIVENKKGKLFAVFEADFRFTDVEGGGDE